MRTLFQQHLLSPEFGLVLQHVVDDEAVFPKTEAVFPVVGKPF